MVIPFFDICLSMSNISEQDSVIKFIMVGCMTSQNYQHQYGNLSLIPIDLVQVSVRRLQINYVDLMVQMSILREFDMMYIWRESKKAPQPYITSLKLIILYIFYYISHYLITHLSYSITYHLLIQIFLLSFFIVFAMSLFDYNICYISMSKTIGNHIKIVIILIVSLFAEPSSSVQFVNVPRCTPDPKPNIYPFTYTINGTVEDTTSAYMCHDDQFLYITWYNIDNDVISTLSKCNDPLYSEDAVQIFIATNSSYPNRYFQFQVSPKGQLFFADIYNPKLICSNLGTDYQACSSVTYSGKITEKGWEANLKIDLKIIGRGKKENVYLGNIYRIDKSRTQPTRYLSFNPTMSSPACFHQPLRFIQFRLI